MRKQVLWLVLVAIWVALLLSEGLPIGGVPWHPAPSIAASAHDAAAPAGRSGVVRVACRETRSDVAARSGDADCAGTF
ncbi:MAG TPA: hypothetical protein VN668_18130 [Stellaceae bacterium]|nr:hypothetical protein [Stellaceae bacterium]